MSMRTGSLATEPLPALLHACYRQRLTGALFLDAAGGRSEILIRDGYPAAVSTGGAIDQLGRVLVEAQLLTEEQLQTASAGAVPDGPAFGRSLVALGLLDEQKLHDALILQLRRRLHRLFFIERGTWVMEPRVVTDDDGLRVQPRKCIYQGLRFAWTPPRLRAAVAPFEGRELRLRADALTVAKYGFSDEDAPIAQRLSQRPSTLADLAQLGAPPEAIHAVVLALHYTEALETAAPAAAARPRSTTMPDVGVLKRTIEARLAAADRGDLYGVLDVPPEATRDQIKTAFVNAAKFLHPDRYAGPGLEALRADVERLFRHLNEAHAVLSDDGKRAVWQTRRSSPPGVRSDEERARAAVEAELAYQEGQVKMKRRDFAGAVAAFARSVELAPDEGEHIAQLAWARVAAGQAQLAEIKEDLQRAIQKSPKAARPHYYLGVLYKEEEQLDRAASSLRQAIQLDPRLAEAESELRLVMMRRERAKQATGKHSILDRLRGRKD